MSRILLYLGIVAVADVAGAVNNAQAMVLAETGFGLWIALFLTVGLASLTSGRLQL